MSFKNLKYVSNYLKTKEIAVIASKHTGEPICPNAPKKSTKMFKREVLTIPKFSLSNAGNDSGESSMEWINDDEPMCPYAPMKTGKYDFNKDYPQSPSKYPKSISYMPSNDPRNPHIMYEY